jgi:hypothetical protein
LPDELLLPPDFEPLLFELLPLFEPLLLLLEPDFDLFPSFLFGIFRDLLFYVRSIFCRELITTSLRT